MEINRTISSVVSKKLKFRIVPTDWLLFLDKDFRKTYFFLKEVESWSVNDVYSWQFQKVKEVILSAYEGTSAYKELYRSQDVHPSDINQFSDLKNIPAIDKIFVKNNYNELVNKAALRSVVRYTGGSTGTPMKFLLDKSKIFQEKAFFYYIWKKHGFKIGQKCLVVKGENISEIYGTLTARDGLNNYLKLDSNYLNDLSKFREFHDAIVRFSPRYAFGFPSALYQLALLYTRSGQPAPRFDLIMLASENTYVDQIDFIKGVFSCPNVFFHYGHSEYAAFAVKYHQSDHLGFVPFYGYSEVVKDDGTNALPGQRGEIISTSYSVSMPLIRYRTQDFAVRSDYHSDDYMRSYLSVEYIDGRLQEYIVTEDLRLVSICTMGAAHFEELGPVIDSQYYQDEPGKLVFRVCCPPEDYSMTLEKRIKVAIERKLENKVSVSVALVREIPRTLSGKKIMIDQRLNIKEFI